MNKTRILLADDHSVVRTGLRCLLEDRPDLEVVGEAKDGGEAVRLAGELNVDIVIMDIEMPRLNGIDAAAQIIRRSPRVGIIILSMHGDDSYLVRRVFGAGAKGYLLKDSCESEIIRAIDVVMQGRPFFSPGIAEILLQDYMSLTGAEPQGTGDPLTDQERETLLLLAEGKTDKEAAVLLNLSTRIVEARRADLLRKLKLNSTAEIVRCAARQNIIA